MTGTGVGRTDKKSVPDWMTGTGVGHVEKKPATAFGPKVYDFEGSCWDDWRSCPEVTFTPPHVPCTGSTSYDVEPPVFSSVALQTQLCFADEYGYADWPATDCCPPKRPKAGEAECEPPDLIERWEQLFRFENHRNAYATDRCKFEFSGELPVEPTMEDLDLFGAAVAVLVDNLDLARWVSCQVQGWSPELTGMSPDLTDWVTWMLTPGADGRYPIHVTFVDSSRANPGARAWAFTTQKPAMDCTLGVIVAAEHAAWKGARRAFERSAGAAAFCAAVRVASDVLHEMVHIAADGFENSYVSPYSWENRSGALHEPEYDPDKASTTRFPRWDEPRMVASMFDWAMAERFPCLESVVKCSGRGEDHRFAISGEQEEEE